MSYPLMIIFVIGLIAVGYLSAVIIGKFSRFNRENENNSTSIDYQNLRERNASLAASITHIERERDEAKSALAEIKIELAGEKNKLEAKAREYSDLLKGFGAIDGELKEKRAELSAEQEKVKELIESRSENSKQINEKDRMLSGKDAEILRLSKEHAAAQTKIQEKEEFNSEILRDRDHWKSKYNALQGELETANLKIEGMSKQREAEQKSDADIAASQQALTHQFNDLAAKALQTNNAEFLKLAKENLEKFQQTAQGDLEGRKLAIENMVAPISKTLSKFEELIQSVEQKRESSYDGLLKQVSLLSNETRVLKNALTKPQSRGAWGERTLQRILELAGMHEKYSHKLQYSIKGEDQINNEERKWRPDCIVFLSEKRKIVIDSKVPFDHYEASVRDENLDQRDALLQKHADSVLAHINGLAKKEYWDALEKSAEFVIMFIPADHLWTAAWEINKDLDEYAAKRGIYIATPMMLMALLNIIAMGWREEDLAKNAEEIGKLAGALHNQMRVFLENHFLKIGKSLDAAVRGYDGALASYKRNILPNARKFEKLDGIKISKELPKPDELKLLGYLGNPNSDPDDMVIDVDEVDEESNKN